MKKWGKWPLIGIGVLIVLAVVGMNSLKALEVETQAVTKGKVNASVVEKGKVLSEAKVDIFSDLVGKLKEIKVDEGDRVTKGQLIAVMDTTDLEARIAQLEGEYKAVQGMERVSPADNNQIKQQQLALNQASIAFEQAELDLDRTRQLFAAEAVTAQELEQAKAGLEAARKTLAQAEVAHAMAKQQNQGNKLQYQGQRESIQAQLKLLREQRAKASIVAQVEGVVFTKFVDTGDFVNPGNKLFSLGTIGKMKIESYLNSKDMAYVGEGNEVGVVFKLPGKEIKLAGKISKIAPVTEERTSSLGLVEDKVKVTVDLPQYPQELKIIPGMTVDVVFITQQVDQVLGVPKDAVFTDQGKDYVWLVNQGRATLIQITKGIEGDELVEVKSGLTPDQQVILNPHLTGLKEGIRVK